MLTLGFPASRISTNLAMVSNINIYKNKCLTVWPGLDKYFIYIQISEKVDYYIKYQLMGLGDISL